MARAKTVSLRQLQAAVTKALDAAKREHPEFKTDAITLSASPDQLPVLYRYPWFCGLSAIPMDHRWPGRARPADGKVRRQSQR